VRSHHGFPEEYPTYSIAENWLPKFPDEDPITVFGFNYNIQRAHFIGIANNIIDKLVYHEAQRTKYRTKGDTEASVITSIEMNSQKTSLQSSHSSAN
jgi:hypothetical protein